MQFVYQSIQQLCQGKIAVLNNFSDIISRIKEMRGLSTDKEVAELFDLTPQEFSIRKKRGTLLPLVVNWGISQKSDLNWLLTGEGNAYTKDEGSVAVDMDLLEGTIRAVEEWLDNNRRTLSPEKKAKVVRYIYEEYLEREEKPETATVERLLQLVA